MQATLAETLSKITRPVPEPPPLDGDGAMRWRCVRRLAAPATFARCDKIPRQLSSTHRRYSAMTWWVFDNDSGVLSLDNPGLELHWRVVEGRTFAWWVDAGGHMLSVANVGVA